MSLKGDFYGSIGGEVVSPLYSCPWITTQFNTPDEIRQDGSKFILRVCSSLGFRVRFMMAKSALWLLIFCVLTILKHIAAILGRHLPMWSSFVIGRLWQQKTINYRNHLSKEWIMNTDHSSESQSQNLFMSGRYWGTFYTLNFRHVERNSNNR